MKSIFFFSILQFFLISNLSSEKILITGGAGFIGSHLVKTLLEQEHAVIIVDSFNDHYYDPNIKYRNIENLRNAFHNTERLKVYEKNICNFKDLDEIFKRENPTIICHLAASASVKASSHHPEYCLLEDIKGTFNILEMARIHKIKNVVFSSSSSVYGDKTAAPFQECDLAETPCSFYGTSKRSCEMIIYTYHHLYDIPATCLRFFNVYGPECRRDLAPFKFLDALYKEEPIILYGNTMRDMIYIDDVVNGIVMAIKNPQEFEILNLGSGDAISMRNLIGLFEQITGKTAHIHHKKQLTADPKKTCADISRIDNIFGFKPKITLPDGIKKMNNWYLENSIDL